MDQLAVHFQVEGNLIHKESEEAKRQLASQKRLERTLFPKTRVVSLLAHFITKLLRSVVAVPEVMAEKPAKAAEVRLCVCLCAAPTHIVHATIATRERARRRS